MSISVKIPTILRPQTGGEKSVEVGGDTLDAVITDLDAKHAGIRGRLVGDDGGLHRFVNIYVDDEDVRFLGGLATPVKDGQTVTILPAVAGGSGAAAVADFAGGAGGSGAAAVADSAGGAGGSGWACPGARAGA